MKSRLLALLGALFVVLASLGPRLVLHDRTPSESGDSWTVADPDSLYHARRVERLLDEGWSVAGEDPLLNGPEGAFIPWPPYYELVVAGLIAPFAPADQAERHAYIEVATARLPLLFGVLASLVVFLGARSLGGTLAGVLAGLLHALTLGSIAYSCEGNGDHHAFVTLCSALLLWGFAASLKGRRLEDRRWCLGVGAFSGLVAGIAVGSWVASLIWIVIVDAVFAVLLIAHARRPRPGLAEFGSSFHVVALVVLLPAVLQSPWKEEFPWMVVNLSWFHVVYLGIGCLVFAPLLLHRGEARWKRGYPWIVGALLAGFGVLSTALDIGPAAGIREGFEWVSRQDTFMGAVAESRPLLGPNALDGEWVRYLGWQIGLLPVAWLFGLWIAWRSKREELLPWIIAALPLAFQAAGQARFADALSVPASVIIAWMLATLASKKFSGRKLVICGTVLVALAPLAQVQTLTLMSDAGQGPRPDWRRERGSRELCEWIAKNADPDTPGTILANWNRGHEIEWVTGRGSVATNFGSYVGAEGFLAPARFFLSVEDGEAEAVLRSRDARYVVLSCFLSSALPGWILAGDESWEGRYYELNGPGAGRLLPAWYETLGARLLNGGFTRGNSEAERGDSLDFMRLVHASPIAIRRSPLTSTRGTVPFGWVWERVPGARVGFAGPPGTPVAIEIEIAYPGAPGQTAEVVQFLRRGVIGESGRLELRVPYATLANNGDGRVRSARWTRGSQAGQLRLGDDDVLEGRLVDVND